MAILPVHKQYIAVAAKIVAEQIGSESSGPGLESHIYNIYEQLSMPLSDVEEIMDASLGGKLENVQEKVDGQNITFTVVNGVIQFFSKMDLQDQRSRDRALDRILKGDGATPDDIARKYTDDKGMGSLREAYIMAYEALTPVASRYSDSLFQNGNVVIVSSLATPRNPNTIIYEDDNFIFIKPVALQVGTDVDMSQYRQFLDDAEKAKESVFNMRSVPTAKLIKALDEDDEKIEELKSDFRNIIGEAGLSIKRDTVGDYALKRVENLISSQYSFIPPDMVRPVALRFVTGRGAVANNLKKVISSDEYKRYQDIDKRKSQIVDESIIPLEEIIQRLGVMVVDRLDLALKATNSNELLSLVKTVRSEFERGVDFIDDSVDPQKAKRVSEGIRVALERLQSNEDLFKTATEGIVFTWKDGKTYKLTGLFTPINRLKGFFSYSGAKSPHVKEEKISESNFISVKNRVRSRWEKYRVIHEGGSAFKNSSGDIITRPGRIPRSEVYTILKSFEEEVLKPLGINHEPVGSAGSNTETVGDIDIAVDIASRNVLADVLAGHLDSEKVKKLPGIVAVMFKVPDSDPEEFVQIDVVPSSNISDTQWLMMGGAEGQVKGVYRNLLLAYLAKTKSDRESSTLQTVKYTLTFPGGLLKRVNGSQVAPREPDPDLFLSMLGFPKELPKGDIESFEGLVDYMKRDPSMSTILSGFKDYIDNNRYLRNSNEVISDQARAAVDYINEKALMESIIKNRIMKLLTEETESDVIQPEQLRLLTPTAFSPASSITPAWLADYSVPDNLYDVNSKAFILEGVPALLMGYEDSALDNEGEKFEEGVIAYADYLGLSGMERIGGQGEDLRMGNRTYESKKSKDGSPTLMFNSTFPKSRPQHFYLFALNIPPASLIRDVSDNLKSELGISERWNQMSKEDQKRLSEAWLDSQSTVEETSDELEKKIQKIDSLMNNPRYWRERVEVGKTKAGSRKTQPAIGPVDFYDEAEVDEEEPEEKQTTMFEGVNIDGTVFNTKKELQKYKKLLQQQLGSEKTPGPLASRIRALGVNIKAYIVPSSDLRVAIMHSAFPGAFEGPDQIFNPQTGAVVKGGEEKIVKAIKDYLDNFGLEYKIAEKIAPELIKDLVSGLDTSHEDGWTMRMGLLGVRIKVYMEPRKTKI